jgi:hypothetical protein
MLLPLGMLAASGHGPAWDALQQLSNRDSDKHIRETAARISEIIAPDLLLSALVSEVQEDKRPIEPVPNADLPVPIASATKQSQSDQMPPIPARSIIYCMKCGAPNAAANKFCLKCGQPLAR